MVSPQPAVDTKGLGSFQKQALSYLSSKKGLTRNVLAGYCYGILESPPKYLSMNGAFNTYHVLISLQKRGLVEQREDKLWYLVEGASDGN